MADETKGPQEQGGGAADAAPPPETLTEAVNRLTAELREFRTQQNREQSAESTKTRTMTAAELLKAASRGTGRSGWMSKADDEQRAADLEKLARMWRPFRL